MKIYKETTTVIVRRLISYAHRILNHPGKCKNLHGHNSTVEVQVSGPITSETGMVVDFGDLKEIIDRLDHATLLQEDDSLYSSLEERVFVMEGPPTAEELSWLILRNILKQYPNLDSIKVTFPETPDSIAITEWSRIEQE